MSRLDLVTLLSTVGCGLVAGFFFAFLICVMKALGRLPAEQGITAMQSINVVVINPWFLTAFFGTGPRGAMSNGSCDRELNVAVDQTNSNLRRPSSWACPPAAQSCLLRSGFALPIGDPFSRGDLREWHSN
jgi:hypothetical protein